MKNDLSLILWGEWMNQENDSGQEAKFYTPEIPDILEYPFESQQLAPFKQKRDKKTPRLLVRCYGHESKGQFTRCLGFAVKGKEVESGSD